MAINEQLITDLASRALKTRSRRERLRLGRDLAVQLRKLSPDERRVLLASLGSQGVERVTGFSIPDGENVESPLRSMYGQLREAAGLPEELLELIPEDEDPDHDSDEEHLVDEDVDEVMHVISTEGDPVFGEDDDTDAVDDAPDLADSFERPVPMVQEAEREGVTESIVAELRTASSFAHQMRIVKERASTMESAPPEDFLSVVEVFPPGWRRRRVLASLLRAGAVQSRAEAEEIVAACARSEDRRWLQHLLPRE